MHPGLRTVVPPGLEALEPPKGAAVRSPGCKPWDSWVQTLGLGSDLRSTLSPECRHAHRHPRSGGRAVPRRGPPRRGLDVGRHRRRSRPGRRRVEGAVPVQPGLPTRGRTGAARGHRRRRGRVHAVPPQAAPRRRREGRAPRRRDALAGVHDANPAPPPGEGPAAARGPAPRRAAARGRRGGIVPVRDDPRGARPARQDRGRVPPRLRPRLRTGPRRHAHAPQAQEPATPRRRRRAGCDGYWGSEVADRPNRPDRGRARAAPHRHRDEPHFCPPPGGGGRSESPRSG